MGAVLLDIAYVSAIVATGIGALALPFLFGDLLVMVYAAAMGLLYFPYLAITRLVRLANISREPRFLVKATIIAWMFGIVAGFIGLSACAHTYLGLKDMANNGQVVHDPMISLYFSVVTWTTLGYGDFAPANNYGRAFAVWEALNGYLVMAILIAALISLFRSPVRHRTSAGEQ